MVSGRTLRTSGHRKSIILPIFLMLTFIKPIFQPHRYEARVTAVTGSSDSPLYTVIFKGYTTPTTLNSSQVRALTLNNVQAPPDPVKRKADEMDEREKEKKKKKNEKWTSTMTARTEETVQKKNAWESFGKKAAKKGVKIGGYVPFVSLRFSIPRNSALLGHFHPSLTHSRSLTPLFISTHPYSLQGKSIFRTPDNPMGKVGVVGSGQGVTAYEQRGKHKFQPGSTGNAE